MPTIANLLVVYVHTIVVLSSVVCGLRMRVNMIAASGGSSFAQPSGLQELFEHNPTGLRIFHPSFPLEILKPLTLDEAENISRTKQLMGVSPLEDEDDEKAKLLQAVRIGNKKKYLPWYTMPRIGVPDATSFMSSVEIADAFEKERHRGQLVWAYTMERPKKGCLLLNHWQQRVVYITDYDVERGAQGYDLNHITQHDPAATAKTITWPPLALEFELTDDLWQPVAVSENIINGSVMNLLPTKLGAKAFWELIMLLLVSTERNPEAMQAFMDTGLSPNKGLIAYLRLLEKVIQRTSTYDDIPDYRKIMETDIFM